MSQIGGELPKINLTQYPSDEESEHSYTDQKSLIRAIILLSASTFGLIGNALTLLMVIVVKRLQKPYNSFFIHHCILDTVKSAYCIVFSKSLFEQKPPTECAILGASYIVFVTTSAFNILAVTINEIYHFTNRVVGVHINNRCCVLFGLCITWFASIIVNLGVAFLPGNPTFDRATFPYVFFVTQIGYCTFMYGVTGNYLLHVLWIILITAALLLSAIYLRKLWVDIQGRAFDRVSTLFHNTLNINLDDSSETEKMALCKRNIQKTIKLAHKNFYLLAGMVLIFIIFWYPLFILTLADPYFNAPPNFYRSLTIFAWCHSALTPIFFIIYNHSSLRQLKSKLTMSARHKSSMMSTHTLVESTTSNAPERSPIRPNSLNIKPYYDCTNHVASGRPCSEQNNECNGSVSNISLSRRKRAQSLGTAKLAQQSELPSDFHRRQQRGTSLADGVTYIQDSQSRQGLLQPELHHVASIVEIRKPHKNEKMGLAGKKSCKSTRSFKTTNLSKTALSNEVIAHLLKRKLSPTFVQHIINLQEKTNRRSLPILATDESDTSGVLKSQQAFVNTCNRSVTFPEQLGRENTDLEVEVNSFTNPSTDLYVHRLSADNLSSPIMTQSLSDFHITDRHVQWV